MTDDELRDLVARMNSRIGGNSCEPGTPEGLARIEARYGPIPEQAAALHRVAARGRIGACELVEDWADPSFDLMLLSEVHAVVYLRGEDPYVEVGMIDPEGEILFLGRYADEFVGIDLRAGRRGEVLSFTLHTRSAPDVYVAAKDLFSFLRYRDELEGLDLPPSPEYLAAHRALLDKYGISNFYLT